MFKSAITFLLRSRLITFLFFCIIGLILYSQTIKFGYTDLDDSILIEENFSFLEKGNASEIFTQSVFSMRPEDHDNYYRPLLIASFMLDAQMAGKSLKVFHISNIIIHIVASFLLFLFLVKLCYKEEHSLVIALLFLCHPVFTTAVAWIPGRNDSLLAVFVLGVFIKQIDYYRNPTILNLLFHHLLFLLCLFTKETAIFLPLLLFYFHILSSKDKSISKKNTVPAFNFKKSKSINFIIGWVFSIGIYEYLRHKALIHAGSVSIREMMNVFSKYAPSMIQYIGKIIFPFNLSTYPIMEDTTYLFGLLALILIFVFVILKRITYPKYYWLGFIWFILFLLPVAIIKENTLEHRLYLPAIGFSLMCIESSFINKIQFEKGVARWVILTILLLFSFLTIINTKNYKDEITFWTKALETSPHSAKAHFQIGSYYQIDKKTEDAEKEYKIAIGLNSDLSDVHNNLGKVYIQKGMLDKAEEQLLKELEIKPSAVAYYNLATIEEERGNFEKAKILLGKSLEINSKYSDALLDLGILYAREGKYDEAMKLCQKTIQADPANRLAYKNIALIHLAKKEWKQAKEYYIKSKQMGVDINIPLLDTLNLGQ